MTTSDEAAATCLDAQEQSGERRVATADMRLKTALGPYADWAVLAALIVVMVAQLWTSVTQLSVTSDEVDHLHAGYRYFQCNDFGWNPEHPPLVKMVAALPLQAIRINDPISHACGLANNKEVDFKAGHDFLFANREIVLTSARFAVSIFSILLLVTAWCFARRVFGFAIALICGLLLAFEPNLLAHGALVTTDVAAAAAFVLAVYALYRYLVEPDSTRLLALGLAVGFALCVKHSAVLLAVVVPAVLGVDALLLSAEGERKRKLLRYSAALLATGAIALTVLWASYGFRYAARPVGAEIWTPGRLPVAHGVIATEVVPQFERWHVLPQAYLVGLQDVLVESELGRHAFLLGRYYTEGHWFYFPMVVVIKFTLPLLAMVVLSVLSWRFWRSRRRELLVLLLPAILYLGFSMTSKLNIGIRHLLPILPLLVIFAAAGVWEVARCHRWARLVLAGLLVFHAASSLHVFPNYISYSNELWGGPSQTYRYLANADVDWGQAQKMARAYLDKTHPANCFFLRTYASVKSDYGIPCKGISELEWDTVATPFTGTMIVSSSMVDGIGVRGVSYETRRSFKDLAPVAKLGGSALLVYQGTIDLRPIVAVELTARARAVGEQDPQLAVKVAQQAAAMDPLSGDAHIVMCTSYEALAQMDKAEAECNRGLQLVENDPQYGPQEIQRLKAFISRKGLQIYSSASAPR